MNTNTHPMTHVDDVGDEMRDRIINGDPRRVPTRPGDPWYAVTLAAALAAVIHDDMRADIDVTPR